MNKLDIDFLEKYKRLDNLCKDILSSNTGVTSYIDKMTSLSYGFSMVSSWENDLKRLKHIRWVRNKLTHDNNSDGLVGDEEINFVNDFYNQIMNQEDPFSKLRKIEIEREKRRAQIIRDSKKAQNNKHKDIDEYEINEKKQKSIILRTVIYFGIALLIAILFLIYK